MKKIRKIISDITRHECKTIPKLKIIKSEHIFAIKIRDGKKARDKKNKRIGIKDDKKICTHNANLISKLKNL